MTPTTLYECLTHACALCIIGHALEMSHVYSEVRSHITEIWKNVLCTFVLNIEEFGIFIKSKKKVLKSMNIIKLKIINTFH